jgi:hypothetical protein
LFLSEYLSYRPYKNFTGEKGTDSLVSPLIRSTFNTNVPSCRIYILCTAALKNHIYAQ